MTPEDREAARDQLFGSRDQKQSLTAGQALKEALLTVAPGLKTFREEAGAKLKQLGSHGAQELANALFSGQAFVLYQHDQKMDGQDKDKDRAPEHTQGEQGHEHGRSV